MARLPDKPRWETLIDLITDRGYRNVAEIGVAFGNTTEKVAESCDLDLYVLVDETPEKVKPVMDMYWAEKPLVLFPMRSVEASQYIADGSLDLVFIDAMHNYEEGKADILAWMPKVRPGGILCGHDYTRHHHTQVFSDYDDAIDELLGTDLDYSLDSHIRDIQQLWVDVWIKYL